MKSQAAGLSLPQLFALIGYIAPTGQARPAVDLTPTCKSQPAAFPPAAGLSPVERMEPQPDQLAIPRCSSGEARSLRRRKAQTKMGIQSGRRHHGTIPNRRRRRPRIRRQPDRSPLFARRLHRLHALGISDRRSPSFRRQHRRREWNTSRLLQRWRHHLCAQRPNRRVDLENNHTQSLRHHVHGHSAILQRRSVPALLLLRGSPRTPTPRSSAVRFAAAWWPWMPPPAKRSGRPSPFRKRRNPRARIPWERNCKGLPVPAIWSNADHRRNSGVLYVATGDNYSDPPTNTSDAILAMNLKTGELLWSQQLTDNDAFNNGCSTPQKANCPEEAGPDYDFGQPPILVSLGAGKRALVIAQKSGMVHAVDPDQKGKILWQTRAGAGSALGGSQWGSAADAQNVYVAISDPGIGGVADPKSPLGFRLTLDPKKGGGLHALDLKTGKIAWSAKPIPCAADRTDCSPAQSAAVTAIPGVDFLRSGRRAPAGIFGVHRRSSVGHRYRARISDRQRQTGAWRIDGRRRPSRGQRHGVRQLRLLPMGRHAR